MSNDLENKKNIKLVLVEDDHQFLDMLSQFLISKTIFDIKGSYLNGELFLKDIDVLETDVVIMDLQLAVKSGIECIQVAKMKRPEIQYIVLTSFFNEESIFQSLCAGASGYLLKTESLTSIFEGIVDVMNGGSPMSSLIARRVVNSFFKPEISANFIDKISQREKEIVLELAKGLNYKQIASALYISPETVRTHIRNVYEKLQVKSKVAAINKLFNRNNLS